MFQPDLLAGYVDRPLSIFIIKTCDIQYINIKVIKFESKNKYNIFKSDVLSLSLVTGEIVEACEKLKAKINAKTEIF